MHPLDRIPPSLLAAELAYVAGSAGLISRIYRCIRAAWRCSWMARRQGAE